MTFTAEHVRALIPELRAMNPNHTGEFHGARRDKALAMLEAFAARLEQDARPFAERLKDLIYEWPKGAKTLADVIDGTALNLYSAGVELGRADGRREILAEIAKVSPWWHNLEDEPGIISRCVGCDVPEGDEHAPDCLWRRAQPVAAKP